MKKNEREKQQQTNAVDDSAAREMKKPQESDKQFNCSHCDSTFEGEEALKAHEDTHDESLIGPTEPKKNPEVLTVDEDENSQKSDGKRDNKPFRCEPCDKGFFTTK